MRTFSAAAAAVAFSTLASAAVTTPITVKGNAFFQGDERFYIRGVDYQPGGSSNLADPLANITSCSRDIPVMQELGLNTVRVYTIDNSADHSECMKLLSDAGIYLILDVNTPQFSINREYPMYSYNEIYLQHVFATVDVFAQYTNTLGFFAANEVTNDANTTRAATVVKAVIRDMKEYIAKHVDRPIPVGYSAADVAENRMQMAEYLDCGDSNTRGDFYAINDYSWCGSGSSFQISGWEQKVKNYTDYSVPIFLSEFGCNKPSPRVFDEIKSLYSTDMTGVFSGGLVYEFTQEPNNYGLVEVSGDGKSVKKLVDFDNLKEKYEATSNPTGDGGYQENLAPRDCPPQTNLWAASNTLPDLPSKASPYMESGAGTPKGTNGASNQYTPPDGSADLSFSGDASTSGTGTASPSGTGQPGAAFGNREMVGGSWWISVIVPMAALAGAMLVF